MEKLRKYAWIVLAAQIMLLVYAACAFDIEDVRLSKGKVTDFNNGWTLTREDGTSTEIDLPYFEPCEAGKKIVLENTLPKENLGETLSFLTSDKTVTVEIDGRQIYEFGLNDKRLFGNTPGSVQNFVDIPDTVEQGHIRIEFVSNYEDYGAQISSMTFAKRDVAVLKLFEVNIIEFIACSVILLSGVLFCMMAIVEKLLGKDSEGVEYLGVYCLVAFTYYFVEIKAMNLFFGNQTVVSLLGYMMLMSLPIFLIAFYERGIMSERPKFMKILMAAAVTNAAVQLVLQVTDTVPFRDMVSMSNLMLFICIGVFLVKMFLVDKEKFGNRYWIEVAGLLALALTGLQDLYMTYTVHVELLERYSLYGTSIFCCFMMFSYAIVICQRYYESVAENARLLEKEFELIEKKNKELKAAEEKANAANQAKTEFLARMSHEIRTPINAVLGMNEMILRESNDDNIQEYAENVESAAKSLLGIINEILDLSKIESGKMSLVPVNYDISSMLHDVVAMMSVRAKEKNLDFEIDIDENIPVMLYGDDIKIKQILTNLLANAVKYTIRGEVRLSVSGQREGDKVVLNFKVKDSGIGIREQDMPRLFKAFERIEESRNREVEGTGLGMNITLQLLKLMESNLNVDSKYGEGTVFSFSLEQQVMGDTLIGDFQTRFKNKIRTQEEKYMLYAPGKRVLVVDDNDMNRKVFCALLKNSRIKVDEADSGEACIALVRKYNYDIIFLDHMMPEMDGLQTLSYMQGMNDNINKKTPVVALTANAITGAREYYLQQGFAGYLAKPILPEKLDTIICRFLPDVLMLPKDEFDTENKFEGKETDIKEEDVILDDDGIVAECEISLPEVQDFDWVRASKFLPNADILEQIVEHFYINITDEQQNITKWLENIKAERERGGSNDGEKSALDEYRIGVHALKNTSATVGNTKLSGMAKQLEEAAREKDFEMIESQTPNILKELEICRERLGEVFDKKRENENAKKASVESKDDLNKMLFELRESLQDIDIGVIDEAMERLKAFSYDEELQNFIDSLDKMVFNLEFSEATKAIDSFLKREG